MNLPTWCPECGPKVDINEDGCCVTCGASATGRGAVAAHLAIIERDEARAEVEHAYREGGALYEAKIAEREAFRSGAEAMREACAREASVCANHRGEELADILSALPTPEEP